MIQQETIHRMTRRREGRDYCAPAAYMITLTLADRSRGWMGCLETREHHGRASVGKHQGASIALTALGRLVAEQWREIAANWPGVEIGDFIIMPDHLHGIIKITRRQSHPLGQIIGSFKARSTSLASKLASTMAAQARASTMPPIGGAMVPENLLSGASLWASGLTDSILWGRERYERARAYIADNPRRLAEKRANPALFTIKRDLEIMLPLGEGGAEIPAHFSAIGNDGLLERLDFHQVQCSRRFFAYARDKYGKPLKNAPPVIETAEFQAALAAPLAAAKDGAVLVNPCISQGEREIARRVLSAGAAMIVLKNKGFSPLFKPEGALFDCCSAGRLLMLAPAAWPFTPGNKPMTREDACALNRIAQAIARDGAAEIDYKGLKPRFIDESARKACNPSQFQNSMVPVSLLTGKSRSQP